MKKIIYLCVVVFFLGVSYFSSEDTQKIYLQIERGDNMDRVLQLLGEPTKVTECDEYLFWDTKPLGQDTKKQCKKIYWYGMSGVEMWTFGFDSKQNVISKYHHVSP